MPSALKMGFATGPHAGDLELIISTGVQGLGIVVHVLIESTTHITQMFCVFMVVLIGKSIAMKPISEGVDDTKATRNDKARLGF